MYEQIDEILENVSSLPSLPGAVRQLRRMLDEPDVPMKDIGQVISTDPGIAMKTLRLVNSAQYGIRQKVTSVEQAATMLGAEQVRSMVMSAVVFTELKKGTDAFIRHSICCGIAMEMLCEASSVTALKADEAFVYGVIHDIGKIVFHEHLPAKMQQAEGLAYEEGIPLFEAERQVIGADHAAMGARLALHWDLSEDMVSAIAGHHDLGQCLRPEHHGLAGLLSVADYICWTSGLQPEPFAQASVPKEAWDRIGLTAQDIPPVLDGFFDALPYVEELVRATEG